MFILSEILNKIDKAEHIVLISHVNPDADSLGSASAMYSFLLQNYKKVSWFCKTEDINQKLSFVPWFEKIKTSFPISADLAISFDCADKKRLGTEIECDLINIDHHESNSNYGDINFVKPDFISTTAVLYDFFKVNNVKINKKMATALYAGLIEDSDCFISKNVDGTTFALAKELIDSGADFQLCNKKIMKSTSLSALKIKGYMLRNISLECDARVAVFCVSYEDMKSTGAMGEDCEDALSESLYLPYVEVALLLRQNSDYTIKGSIRSNNDINVSAIAGYFGGGGHRNRAGFIISKIDSLNDVKERVINLIKKEI